MTGQMPAKDAQSGGAAEVSISPAIPWRMLFPLPLPPISNDSRAVGQAPATCATCPKN